MAVTSAGTVTASGPLDVGLGGPLRQLQGDLGLDDRGLALALGGRHGSGSRVWSSCIMRYS
jgi:hypothetical protein